MLTYGGMNLEHEQEGIRHASGTSTAGGTTQCTAAEAGAAPTGMFGVLAAPLVAWVEKGEHGKIRGIPRDLIIERAGGGF